MSVVGYNRSVLSKKETTYGTAVVPDVDLGLIQNLTENSRNTMQRIYSLADIDAQDIVAGTFEQNLSLEIAFQHSRILEYIIGSVTHAETTGDWVHTFAEANSLPSMTLGLDADLSTDVVKRYAGTKTAVVALSLALDGILSVRADLLAKTVADSTTATAATISTLITYPAFFATLQTGTAGTETTVTEVQNVEVTFGTDAARIYGLSSRLLSAQENFKRRYDFAFSAGFVNVTEYERVLGSTSPNTATTPTIPSFQLDVTNGTALGSGRRRVLINIRNSVYDSFSEPTNVDGFIIADFSGFGRTLTSMVTTDNISNTAF